MREWNNILNKELDEKNEDIRNKEELINIIENEK